MDYNAQLITIGKGRNVLLQRGESNRTRFHGECAKIDSFARQNQRKTERISPICGGKTREHPNHGNTSENILIFPIIQQKVSVKLMSTRQPSSIPSKMANSDEPVPGKDSHQIHTTSEKPTEPTDDNNNTDPKTNPTADQEEGDGGHFQTSDNQDNQDSQGRESEYGLDTSQENNIS